jgi:hypothetical protein
MQTPDSAALVDRILALTDQVQQFVDRGHWADASELEAERLALLTDLFARDDVAELGRQRVQLARDLLARNGLMIDALRHQRGRLTDASRRLTAAPRAVSAYRANAPSPAWGQRRAG